MKEYVVWILLNSDLKETLLLERNKEPFKGLLNGVGGKLESTETHEEAAFRELWEETYYERNDLSRHLHLVSFTFPYGVVLHAYLGVLKEGLESRINVTIEEGQLSWVNFENSALFDAKNPSFAGDGNLAYLMNLSLEVLKNK